MNYSHMITKAFRTLKSGGLWGFVITTQLAVLALFAVGALASLALVGGVAGVTRLSTLSGSSAAASPATWLVLIPIFGIFTLCGLLAIPIALIEYGGLIHLTDEYQAGRSTSVKDGWAFGTRRMGRTLLVDIVVGIVLGVVCTALAYTLWTEGVSRIRVQHSSILGYLEPVSAPFYALLLLGERPGAWTLMGGALIIVAGVLVVTLGERDQPEELIPA